MRTRSLGPILATGLVLTIVLPASQTAVAQPPGGFGAEMMMDRLDENDDGRLDPEELAQSRFPLRDMAQRAGVDASRGLDADDVERILTNMREQGGGFGGFGGDRGGRGGSERGGSDRGGRGGGDRGNQAKAPVPPPRVTVDLQATYAPGDSNADGQLELSEWLRWKGRAALAEFLSFDRNHDGMLTPRELAQADSPLPVDLALRLPGVDPAALSLFGSPFAATNPTMMSGPPTSASPTSGTTAPGAAATTAPTGAGLAAGTPPTSPVSAPAAPSSADAERHTATAERFFKILDRDGDGKISDLEWQRSSRLRPKFEHAGADLSQPMDQQQFVSYYVKFSISG